MSLEDLQVTKDLVARDFELEAVEEQISEEQLFDLLADRVAFLLENRVEFLLSLMYRLDIDEHLVNEALSLTAPEPANIGLTRLILNRQKQRAFTKRHYKTGPIDEGDEWDF
ncbi:MAG TPA: hypothetical protein PKE06_06300 [Flavilitoribacter sp.]|nr:hypothetical protein [Lewinella sp.]MCB9277709.1 hypothetical protein [Lewinellaceae bacterium]HMQ60263.1 hypothetical protein [Flavilitoribacter sp.]HMQ85990.1 hypothetical protein [Flavilitoribacter sp.]